MSSVFGERRSGAIEVHYIGVGGNLSVVACAADENSFEKLASMVEGLFQLIQSEKSVLAFKDDRLNYLSVFWSNGCLAVIEKWVLSDFAQPKDFILETLSHLDEFLEEYIARQLG